MITFVDGKVEKSNATVTLGDKKFPASYQRDEEGNVNVVFDYELEPEPGDPVVLILHAENNSTYTGELWPDGKGTLIYKG